MFGAPLTKCINFASFVNFNIFIKSSCCVNFACCALYISILFLFCSKKPSSTLISFGLTNLPLNLPFFPPAPFAKAGSFDISDPESNEN